MKNKTISRILAFFLACVLLGAGFIGCGGKDTVPETSNADLPLVTIEMQNGKKIYIELYPGYAPTTVCNFIYLINQGYYDGVTFHRVEKDILIQGGDPTGTGSGGPGYTIPGEFLANGYENYLSHGEGIVSMARASDYNSGGSQFFICFDDSWNTSLNGYYAAFGCVIQGMDVVKKVKVGDVMKKVTVDTKGIDYPEPTFE